MPDIEYSVFKSLKARIRAKEQMKNEHSQSLISQEVLYALFGFSVVLLDQLPKLHVRPLQP